MPGTDQEQSIVPPSETSGGAAPDAQETAEKGDWAGKAGEGIVPADLGGADAPPELKADEDPDIEGGVLGQTTGSDEPATESGVDLSGGDNADATSQGGPPAMPDDPNAEPDVKDGAAQPVREMNLNPSDQRA
jgi:hypothetical protein